MKILVTGAGGFVGGHLMPTLEAAGHEVVGTTLDGGRPGMQVLDLRDPEAVRDLIAQERPDGIIHLAGLAYVPAAEADPGLAVSTNIGVTALLLHTASEIVPRARVLYISSGEVYGRSRGADPIPEQTPPDPTTTYSITKIAAEQLALHLCATRRLPVIVARPFNHLGPGQSELFVAPAFARQLAEIEAGQREPVVRVGNLEARRDFTDVRDVVAAYTRLIDGGQPGEVYNVCSGRAVTVQHVLAVLLEQTRVEVTVAVDPERLRPSDLPVFCGDPAKLKAATGWLPEISLQQTLADVLQDWRVRLAESTPSANQG